MATDSIDYYSVLGISRGASQDEVRKAYRKLARQYHPDMNQNNAEADRRFKAINEANEVLGDPDNRKKYDKYGKDWQHADQIEAMRQQQGNMYGGMDAEGFDMGNLSSMFEGLFGGRGFGAKTRPTSRKGQDINGELVLSLKEAYQSHKRTVNTQGKQIRINIPAGAEEGQSIRLAGYGQPSPTGGPAGDLILTYRFEPDPVFTREGNHLHAKIEVDLFTALLGGEHELQSFSGPLRLKIKAGSQNGTKLRLKGKGYPVHKQADQYGDLIVEIQVKLPTSLSDAETDLIKQWADMRKA